LFELPLKELVEQKLLSIDPGVMSQLDTSQKLSPTQLKPLSYGELKTLYAKEKVPTHRFGFEFAHKLSGGPISQGLNLLSTGNVGVASGQIPNEDLSEMLGVLLKLQGDTSFEQM